MTLMITVMIVVPEIKHFIKWGSMAYNMPIKLGVPEEQKTFENPCSVGSLVVVVVALGPQQNAVVVPDAGEGCGRDETALDQVVLQVNCDQRRVLRGVRVAQGVHWDIADEVVVEPEVLQVFQLEQASRDGAQLVVV